MKMPVYRSENGTFYSQCFYRDGRGTKRHKVKRGFATELEALMWEKDFLAVHNGTMDMLFIVAQILGQPFLIPSETPAVWRASA